MEELPKELARFYQAANKQQVRPDIADIETLLEEAGGAQSTDRSKFLGINFKTWIIMLITIGTVAGILGVMFSGSSNENIPVASYEPAVYEEESEIDTFNVIISSGSKEGNPDTVWELAQPIENLPEQGTIPDVDPSIYEPIVKESQSTNQPVVASRYNSQPLLPMDSNRIVETEVYRMRILPNTTDDELSGFVAEADRRGYNLKILRVARNKKGIRRFRFEITPKETTITRPNCRGCTYYSASMGTFQIADIIWRYDDKGMLYNLYLHMNERIDHVAIAATNPKETVVRMDSDFTDAQIEAMIAEIDSIGFTLDFPRIKRKNGKIVSLKGHIHHNVKKSWAIKFSRSFNDYLDFHFRYDENGELQHFYQKEKSECNCF